MSRPRRYTITALRDLPEIGLQAGDTIIVDRRHPIAPVTFGPISMMDPEYLCRLSHAVFHCRRAKWLHRGKPPEAPALSITPPSPVGAQTTIENIHSELMKWPSRAKDRTEARRASRAALATALAGPLEAAPREPHAAGLLGTEGWRRLARRPEG